MPTTPDPRELFKRYEGNPLIRASDFPRMVNATFNPQRWRSTGRRCCSCASRKRSGLSHLAVATSANGRTGWVLDRGRVMLAKHDRYEEHWGIEDPRIARVGDEYFIVYTGFSMSGPLVCLA